MENNTPNVSWVKLYRKQIWIGVSSLVIIIFGIMLGLHFSKHAASPSPSPIVAGLATTEPTATPVADRTTISILVKNGTGIGGEAGYLQGVLKTMGYSNISITDADTSNNTDTGVTYSSSVDKSISDEITQKLKGIYQVVDTSTSSSQTQDVVIITGLRVGQTPLPASTATPVPTNTPTSVPNTTPTDTPTPTPTPASQTYKATITAINPQTAVPADGSSLFTINVNVTDQSGNAMGGVTVGLSSDSNVTFNPADSANTNTDNSGNATFTATSTVANTYTITVLVYHTAVTTSGTNTITFN